MAKSTKSRSRGVGVESIPGEDGTPYPVPEGFDDILRGKIERVASEAGHEPVTDADWYRLGQAIGEFWFYRGMLGPSDVRLVAAVALKAKALLPLLTKASKAGLDRFLAREAGLDEAAITSHLLPTLEKLSRLPAPHPYEPEEVKVDGTKMSKDEVRLIEQLVAWWELSGRRASARHDDAALGTESPFVRFVKLMVSPLSDGQRPHASAKTLGRRMNAAEKVKAEEQERMVRLAAKLLAQSRK